MHPIGTFLNDPDYSDFPVVCIQHCPYSTLPMLLSRVEFKGDYYASGEALEIANIDIVEKLAVLGRFGDWFLKVHNDIVEPIMVEFALTVLNR
tara:strand:- start:117 stop:395 length:279 start_codon:yes stop_codon:yes gene_type:complete